jgi:hypothetical protein
MRALTLTRQPMRTGWFVTVLALLIGGAGACSASSAPDAPQDAAHPDGATDSSSSDGGSADGDDDAVACLTSGYHVDTFALGMKKAGNAGLFTFELANADPAPPNEPQWNTWTIEVLDSSGAPVTGAVVSLPMGDSNFPFPKNPWMPTMHHGSSVANTVTNNGDGSATIKTFFSMAGLWEMGVMAQSGSMTDEAMFSFCLP